MTLNRRNLLFEGAGAMLLAQAAASGAAKPPIFTHDLPDLDLRNWTATAVEVNYAPGEASAPHRHPGITIAYVLEGEILSKIGDGAAKVYKVGEMFLETPNQLHATSANASQTKPARLLAILLAEKGKPLTSAA
jgi:quercetin dioxygenase-like cupin family protein